MRIFNENKFGKILVIKCSGECNTDIFHLDKPRGKIVLYSPLSLIY